MCAESPTKRDRGVSNVPDEQRDGENHRTRFGNIDGQCHVSRHCLGPVILPVYGCIHLTACASNRNYRWDEHKISIRTAGGKYRIGMYVATSLKEENLAGVAAWQAGEQLNHMVAAHGNQCLYLRSCVKELMLICVREAH